MHYNAIATISTKNCIHILTETVEMWIHITFQGYLLYNRVLENDGWHIPLFISMAVCAMPSY